MRVNRFLGAILAVLLLAVAACGGDGKDAGGDADPTGSGHEQEGTAAGPEPDLDGVPDVVAEVNGEEIGKGEFTDVFTQQLQQMTTQSQGAGQDVDQDQLKKQVVDNLVNVALLVQEADDRGFEVTQKQTDRELQRLAEQNGMNTPDEFVAALEQQGMDRAMIESQLQDQIRIDSLLADVGTDKEPTDKELRALYQQVKAQQGQAGGQGGQQVPPFAQVRSQLVEQLKSQQESEVAGKLVQALRKQADIQIHL
ncbi:MAG: SurA N-terminal domain-containing protein [Nocardioides sp.]